MDTVMESNPLTEFGPAKFGVELLINPPGVPNGTTAVIDVETDELDNFVGIGIMCDSNSVSYYSTLTDELRTYLSTVRLIGHNIKGDAHWLKNWGVDVQAVNLVGDTMLKSYVLSSTKGSHGLKALAQEWLHMTWPTYDEMTVDGTLDKQSIERVAAYCGTDTVAAFRLNQYLDRILTANHEGYYNTIELPMMQLLFKMECIGVTVNVEYLKELQVDFEVVSAQLMAQLNDYLKRAGIAIPHVKSCPKKEHTHEFKPKSPKQVLLILKTLGIDVDSTDKDALRPHMDHEFVNLMAECRKVQSMLSKFINAWLKLPTLPKIHTTFSQVSIDQESGDEKGLKTGRLSSKEPNLQQVKKPDSENEEDYGRVLRSSFIASDPEKELWVYDFDQFQYRILAHATKEKVLLDAFHNGEDVHEATGKVLFGKSTITKFERGIAKNCNFGAVFGAQAEKIAETAKISVEDAEKFLKIYWQRLPGVTRWIARTKALAHVHKSVKTIFGRVIPLPEIESRNIWDRQHAERQAVNFIIQGGEADIIKVAMLQCAAAGYMPILQVHDELHFEGYPKDRAEHMPKIQAILENVVHLDIPIIANGGYGPNWYLAK